MRVEEVLSLRDYDHYAASRWPHRIPNPQSADLAERLGDCIYDYSSGKPVQREGVHGRDNQSTDLGGENVLISRDFYYFGRLAIGLPAYLLPICHQGQGHRSDSNAPYFDQFVAWLRKLRLAPGQLYGSPDAMVDWVTSPSCGGCTIRCLDDQHDPDC